MIGASFGSVECATADEASFLSFFVSHNCRPTTATTAIKDSRCRDALGLWIASVVSELGEVCDPCRIVCQRAAARKLLCRVNQTPRDGPAKAKLASKR
jgi:hypothetical protein